ncbi:MAG: MFS transporter [Chloroflexota bacterium]|nr:MFS transporter [Chloroflexota bacterium]
MGERWNGLWRHADFLKLWAGQSVSQFGSQITVLALPLTAALTLHASAANMGFLAAASTAPFLLFGLFAGVWVDRLRRRPILMIADIARFVLLLLIPLLALLGALALVDLYVIAFLVGILTVFFEVAYTSFLPAVVGRAHLVDGNSKLETTRSAAQIAGPSAAGALVQLVTAPIAIAVDALSFLVSVLFLSLIRTPEPPPARSATRRRIWAEIGEGLRTVMDDPILRATMGSAGTVNIFGSMLFAVYVLYALRIGISAGLLGLTFAVGNLGYLCGAFLTRRITRRYGIGPTISAGLIVMAVCGLLIPLAGGTLAVIVLCLMIAQFARGFGGTLFNINTVSLRQAITPDHLLGRVNATSRFVSTGALTIGSLAGGTLGAVFGLRPTVALGAIGGLFAVAWVFCSPIRTVREQPALIAERVDAA